MKKSILIIGLALIIALGIIYGVFFRPSDDKPAPVTPAVSAKPVEYFEGVITFEDTYTSSNPAVDIAAVNAQYGTKSEFYFKNGNYKQIYNGTVLKSLLFNSKENRSYIESSTTDTLFFVDCSESNETIVSSEIDKAKDTVLGRNCSVLKVIANDISGKPSRISTYYFDESIGINPEWFGKVHFNSFDMLYAITKSLPIKTIHETENYTVTSVAVSVKKQVIDSTMFQVPHGMVTMKRR